MPAPRTMRGLAATASDLREKAETSRAVATSAHSPPRKLPPMTDCGAKLIEWTTPSRWSTCSRTRAASAARSSASVTSSWTTGASRGKRREIACVSRNWRPKDVKTTSAPSSWASRATWNAIELSVRTPVTRSFLPSRRPISCVRPFVGVLVRRRSVAHAEAAVDGDDGSRDVGGVVGREEVHDAGDLVRRREASRGDRGLVRGLGRLGQLGRHRRLDEPGGDDVRGDAAPAELAGHGPGDADQPGLGCRVVDLTGPAVQPDDGGDEHDAPTPEADHALARAPHAAEGPGEVDVEDRLEV